MCVFVCAYMCVFVCVCVCSYMYVYLRMCVYVIIRCCGLYQKLLICKRTEGVMLEYHICRRISCMDHSMAMAWASHAGVGNPMLVYGVKRS